jgi:poly(3-hydroxybutyrate) depolymerase
VTSAGGRMGTGGTSSSGGATGRDASPDLTSSTGGAGTGGQPGTGGAGGTSTDAGGTSGAVPSAGCGKTPTLASGSRTISSGGQNRSFMLRIPANYDNNHPYPLVFAFHWNGGTMNDIDGGGSSGYTWSYYGLREQADNSTNAKMIFVAPQGNGNGWANSGGQDLTLVDDMLKQLEGDLCVDTTRIFSMGFSYGGGMTYEIACARAKVFRAAAVYSGAQLSGCDGGNDPIAYIGIHGIGDTTCNISGGRSLRDRVVKNNTCTAQNPPEPSAGSGKHTCTSYAGCSSGHPVRWCAFDGGHTPGNVDGGGDDGAKTWTKGEVWQFFTQF